MILRKHRRSGFTTIDNELLNDDRLTFKARGLAAYLLSKPDDWRIRLGHLEQESPQGRGALLSAIDELKAHGYYRVVQERNKNGRITDNRAEIADYPAFLQVNRSAEKPNSGETTLRKTDTNTNNGFIPTTETTPKTDTEDLADASTPSSTSAAIEPEKPLTEQQEWFQAVCWIVGWDHKVITKTNKTQVGQAIRILKEGDYTLDDLRAFWRDIWSQDWRWVKQHSRPTLTQLRQDIHKVRNVEELIETPAPRTKVDGSLAAVDAVMERLAAA